MTVFGIALIDVGWQIFNHGHPFEFEFYMFQFPITGLVMGYDTWGQQEANYQKALKSSPQTPAQLH